ncbi:Histidine protein methyltransferase 1 [Podila humilis]|nr:Histidine protein methyltransferase 1 [Podila humilis]
MFKFNFSADDLEFDDPTTVQQQQQQQQQQDEEDTDICHISKPLENLTVSSKEQEQNLVPAAILDLQSKSCLHSLPSTLHYELAHIPVKTGSGAGNAVLTSVSTGLEQEVVTLYKRNLEDVKFQMAQEDDDLVVAAAAAADAAADATAVDHHTHNKAKETSSTSRGTVVGPGGVEMLALAGKSDLVKGVYEGGLKTWECALDLVAYLAENKQSYDGKKVLELGCGSALPGIYVLTQSSSVKVDLQDYNDQVLKLVTLPNVLLNTHLRPDQQPEGHDEDDDTDNEDEDDEKIKSAKEKGETVNDNENNDEDDDEDDDDDEEDEAPERNPADGDFKSVELDLPDSEDEKKSLLQKVESQSRFFMGDWDGFVNLVDFKSDEDKYDLILTSETIYAEESHLKLYSTIKHSLKRQGGGARALVAAKSFYFGVGGDILSFRKLIEKDGVFNVKVVFSAQAFVRREILELTFKQ